MQLNTGRGADATSAILEIARNDKCDMLMLQEPGGFFSNSRTLPRILGKHFQVYLPDTADGIRPRVATYVRKHGTDWTPVAQTTTTKGNRDILVLDLKAASGQNVRVINIYNAPPGCEGCGEGAKTLMELPALEGPSLVGGDFNLYHDAWAAEWWAGATTAQASAFGDFLEAEEWELGLEKGSITRMSEGGGSALDLVLVNQSLVERGWLASCEVRPDLSVGSDHWPVVTTLTCGQGQAPRRELRFRFARADWDKFRRQLEDKRVSYLEPSLSLLQARRETTATTRTIDQLAESLQRWIFTCLEAAVPRTATTGQGHPWWTAECTSATKQLARLETELATALSAGLLDLVLQEAVIQARATAKRTLRGARRAYYRDQAEKIEGNGIFVARKWALGERQYASPAMRDSDGRDYVTPAEKRNLLRDTLLPNLDRQDPLDVFSHLPPSAARTGHAALTRQELKDAVWAAAPDKAPGPDEITSRALREGWSAIEDPLFALASAAFDAGWYPTAFRNSTLCALKKGGRRDPTLARSYRLIALLPVLGKALEKVAANRLTWFAERFGAVPLEQYGAMPKRSATDAGVALTHDIHVGWAHHDRLTTSVLFFDVVGAFDNVAPGRMVLRLWEIGVPLPLIALIASWLAARVAAIRLDGEVGPADPCATGLPQGSPLSMILFVLFLSPMWDAIPPEVRLFGFVDDGGLRVQSPTIEQNCLTLAQAYEAALHWAQENGLWFDEVKRELIHFPPPRTKPLPELLPVRLGPSEEDLVQPVQRDAAVRWLGIWLNPALSWKHHVRTQAAKARSAVGCMRMLANTVRGPSALLLRRAYVACILTILLYASPVWWRGLERKVQRQPRPRSATLPAHTVRVDGAAELVGATEAVQNVALRLILPVWRTTPIMALQCEASLPPVRLVLDYLRALYAIRLHTLPSQHPITVRLAHVVPPSERDSLSQVRRRSNRGHLTKQTTPLLEMRREVENVERHGPGPTAPWLPTMEQQERFSISLFEGSDKKTVAEQHSALIRGEEPALLVYSDGSLSKAGAAGAGFVLFRAAGRSLRKIIETSSHLHHDKEVFDAEIYGLLSGLNAAFGRAERDGDRKIWAFVDNQAALRALQQTPRNNDSSGSLLSTIRKEISKWLQADKSRSVHLAWVPGHCGVDGNERADVMAEKGSSALRADSRVGSRRISLAKARRRAKEQLLGRWTAEWSSSDKHGAYRKLRTLPPALKPAPHLGTLPRKDLGLWLQAKTGHGDFSTYHTRPQFQHLDAHLHCRCGRQKTRLHPLTCLTYTYHQHLLDPARLPSGRLDFEHFFNDRKGISLFVEYATISRAYSCNMMT
ncbi:hypothetical protein CF326_g4200 [Tilletia indica]|nr:hypothetical protein CF326_g4200 [Tilletia indica]